MSSAKPKSILVIKSSLAAPINGAERSTFERLSMLAVRHSWQTRIFCPVERKKAGGVIKVLEHLGIAARSGEDRLEYVYKNVPVTAWLEDEMQTDPVTNFDLFFKRCSLLSSPKSKELLVCNMRDFAALHFCSTQKQNPAVFFMTENEFPRMSDLDRLPQGNLIRQAYRNAINVVVASDFLKGSVKESWDIEARHFVNAIDVEHYYFSKEHPGNYITMLHPYVHKGIELFLALARQMPDKKFLVMGGSGKEYRDRKPELLSIPNLELLPYMEDIRPIYQQSRIVLVPSIWEEAFSRVVVEALASETPVIAFDRGGIRDAGGDAAIYVSFRKNPLDQTSLNSWKSAIDGLTDTENYRARIFEIQKWKSGFRERLLASMGNMSTWFEELLKNYY